ncbi:MAG: hypothetical protein GF353_11735 [Candidatus Lokiarchaeota archaeon]|nr:hypothetical protein [Candidatus Lokiarchaeota archaeon]
MNSDKDEKQEDQSKISDNNKESKTLQDKKTKVKILDEIDNMRVVANNHFMIGEFSDAKKVANNIINLAKEADLKSIVKEQKDFIEEINRKIAEKDQIKIIKENFKIINDRFQKLIAKNQIPEAHSLIDKFKTKYLNIRNLNELPNVKELISKEKEYWGEFKSKQEKLETELKKLESKFISHLENNEITEVGKIIESAKSHLSDVYSKDMKLKWNSHENQYQEQKRKFEICQKVDVAVEESISLKEQNSFKEALSRIDPMLDLLKNESLPMCDKKLIKTRKDIVAAEIKYKQAYLDLAKLKDKRRRNEENRFYKAAINNCEEIIKLAREISNKDEEKRHVELVDELTKEMEEETKKKQEALENLRKEASKIEDIIQNEDQILPIVSRFSVKDYIGDLSENNQERMEQLNYLLNEHRVKLSNSIISKLLYVTADGEIFQKMDEWEIEKSENNGEIVFNVNSRLKNRSDKDIIESELRDLIPYDYEIKEITYDGNPVERLPKYVLTENGIEIIWNPGALEKNQGILIKYSLRRRISRTIIFPINDEIFITKTHFNLTQIQNKVYRANTALVKGKKNSLDTVLIEDIIPLTLNHYIEHPKRTVPRLLVDDELGQLFKWEINSFSGEKMEFEYILIDNSNFGEIEDQINKLSDQGLQAVNKGKIIEALQKYKDIKNLLLSTVKRTS